MNPNRVITEPLSAVLALEAVRTCCVVGTAPFLRRCVPLLHSLGLSVERLSVPPATRRTDDLEARLIAQDAQVRRGLDFLLLSFSLSLSLSRSIIDRRKKREARKKLQCS